jgi:hypothetical protein
LTLQSEERLPMNFTRLIEHVSKKQVPAHVTFFIVEVMASDEQDEDVEVQCGICPSLDIALTLHCSFRSSSSIASNYETYSRERIRPVGCSRRGMYNMLIVYHPLAPSLCPTTFSTPKL